MKELISDPYKPRYEQPYVEPNRFIPKENIPKEVSPRHVPEPIQPQRQNYMINER